jgi:hypothetical protein
MRMQSYLTVKDVRRLHACVLCGEIGVHQPTHPMLNVPVVVCIHSTKEQRRTVSAQQCSYAHPRCYVEKTSMANLLSLHSDELDSIRLCDVTARQMRKLLAESVRRRAAKAEGRRAG